MIDDDSHPQMHAAHQDLLRKISFVIGTVARPLDRSLLDKLFATVKDHRIHWRMKGVDFPAMVALVVPRLGIVDFKRADLDLPSIRVSIVNFVRMNPEATMEEIVTAFRHAYPDLKPDDVFAKHEAGVQANKIADEKREQRIKTVLGEDDGGNG